MVAIGEHYRSSGQVVPAGIYRVVGIPGDVTVLRVGDPDGRRRHTGEIVSVPPKRIGREFEPADEPGAGFAVVDGVRGAVANLYWSAVAVWYTVRRRLSRLDDA